LCRGLGCDNLLLVIGEYIWQQEVIPPEEQWRAGVQNVRRLAEFAAELGLEIAIELEPFKLSLVNTVNDDAMQGNRLLELLDTMPDLEVYVLNTGRVGGEGEDSKKITIPDSSAIVQGIVEGTIEWADDEDFGYQTARHVPGVEDIELLNPALLYRRLGRDSEYREVVERLRSERIEYLNAFTALDDSVLAGLG
jgi:hypothetical protein